MIVALEIDGCLTATDRDLALEMQAGRFREDLFTGQKGSWQTYFKTTTSGIVHVKAKHACLCRDVSMLQQENSCQTNTLRKKIFGQWHH